MRRGDWFVAAVCLVCIVVVVAALTFYWLKVNL